MEGAGPAVAGARLIEPAAAPGPPRTPGAARRPAHRSRGRRGAGWLAHALVGEVGGGGVRGAVEAGTVALVNRAGERDLADHQAGTADLADRHVHGVASGEDPQSGDLAGHHVSVRLAVAALH